MTPEEAEPAPSAAESREASGGASAWGAGKVRPMAPEPRPPAVGRLGPWWLVAAGMVVGIAWAATDHMLRATVTLASACLLGALLRLAVPTRHAGGLITRGRVFDVVALLVLGGALLAAGLALDLRARV